MSYQPDKWATQDWRPRTMIYQTTTRARELSSNAGLPLLVQLFSKHSVFEDLKNCLPVRRANNSFHPTQFASLFLAGFWNGYDCLDDLVEFKKNPMITEQFGGRIPTAKAFGDFLRDFSGQNILDLRSLLTIQAQFYRSLLGVTRPTEFNMDSTPHEHHGELIEGLAYNYDGIWCLDSLQVFDELGLCHDFDLRDGDTFSSQGAPEMMLSILNQHPIDPLALLRGYIRADSAFCNQDFIGLCLSKKLKGTITAHGNIGWESKVESITNWQPWLYTPEETKKAAELGERLPQIEMGYYMYSPGWAPNIQFPVVVKRTFVPYEKLSHKKKYELIKDKKDPKLGLWEHYGVLSLMGLYPKTPQQIIEFHNQRSQMENMLKEEKMGFDLKHFPCRRMNANHAYALLGMMAHNFFRFIAHLTKSEDEPIKFAKKLRRQFIQFPGRLTKPSQNERIIKISDTHDKEVELLKTRWAATFDPLRLRMAQAKHLPKTFSTA